MFKAHRLLYYSTLGSRVIKKMNTVGSPYIGACAWDCLRAARLGLPQRVPNPSPLTPHPSSLTTQPSTRTPNCKAGGFDRIHRNNGRRAVVHSLLLYYSRA